MKLKIVLILSCFFLLIVNANAFKNPPFENITVHPKPKVHANITFKNIDNNELSLSQFENDFFIINFWATWCAPCKKEMPSLDKLSKKKGFTVLPINLDKENLKKINKFYNNLKIENLPIFFDEDMKLVKMFSLRGIPTTIILNKNRQEIARIIGEVDFLDEKFINWIKSYYK